MKKETCRTVLSTVHFISDSSLCAVRYQNTKELWNKNEILYIATDERNQTFFDAFRKQHTGPLRFFDDYKELAGLDSIDPTLYGMIDTAIASRGSVFAGTWFSTFSGYIIRLRGYYGMSKFYSYYSWLDRKYFMHRWMDVWEGSYYAREYPTAWTSIDGDVYVDDDNEVKRKPSFFTRKEMEKMKAEQTSTLIANRYKDPIQMPDKVDKSNSNPDSASSLDDKPLARGIAGRPMEQTPALVGAKRGHIKECDANVDALAYWNEPQGWQDLTFQSPFGHSTSSKPKYLVFTPDKVCCSISACFSCLTKILVNL